MLAATDVFSASKLSSCIGLGNLTLSQPQFQLRNSSISGLRVDRRRSRNLIMATKAAEDVSAIEFTAAPGPAPAEPRVQNPLRQEVKTTMREESIRLKDVTQDQFPTEYQENDHDEKLLSTVDYNEWDDNEDIPVIDFSRLDSDREGLAAQITDAASEWGFFQLINHRLPLEFLQELESETHKFFDLPAEAKERTNAGGGFGTTWVGDQRNFRPASLRWAESLSVTGVEPVKKMATDVWPDGYTKFRDIASEYFTFVEETAKDLLELLAEGLGVPTDYFSKHYNSKRALLMRYNWYPACPHPSQTVGVRIHTDGCALTILYQDSVGGLQIYKGDKWYAVRPTPGAVVVNIGDMLHAWSNGKFPTILHRAVVNKSSKRLSIAGFCNIDPTSALAAPEEIIDEENPRLFKPIAFMDYLNIIQEEREKKRKDYFYGVMALDRFRIERETAV